MLAVHRNEELEQNIAYTLDAAVQSLDEVAAKLKAKKLDDARADLGAMVELANQMALWLGAIEKGAWLSTAERAELRSIESRAMDLIYRLRPEKPAFSEAEMEQIAELGRTKGGFANLRPAELEALCARIAAQQLKRSA
jgi:hypothetical protein